MSRTSIVAAEGSENLIDDIYGLYEYDGEYEIQESIEEEPSKRKLHLHEARQKLSVISKTEAYNSYAYIKISATDMKLTNINVIPQFKYLLFIDVSGNKLKLNDLQILTTMKFVILIQADRNLLKSAALEEMEYLQVLLLNDNIIKNCEGINQPLLNTLEMRKNKITAINFEYPLMLIRILDLSYNSIWTMKGLDFDSLEKLYLAGNKILDLSGIDTLVNLKMLHLRENPIEELSNFGMNLTKLKYLNLRLCRIDVMDEFKKLKALPALQVLIITGCPVMEGKEETEESLLRSELVAMIKTITRINKTEISDDERAAANDIRQAWEDEALNYEEE